jgi:hypothetical protein
MNFFHFISNKKSLKREALALLSENKMCSLPLSTPSRIFNGHTIILMEESGTSPKHAIQVTSLRYNNIPYHAFLIPTEE